MRSIQRHFILFMVLPKIDSLSGNCLLGPDNQRKRKDDCLLTKEVVQISLLTLSDLPRRAAPPE